jgi:hypothetical protein
LSVAGGVYLQRHADPREIYINIIMTGYDPTDARVEPLPTFSYTWLKIKKMQTEAFPFG